MYLVRDVFHCWRGKAPEIVEDMKTFNSLFVDMGDKPGQIYVDMSRRFDTAIMECEVESLDQYYVMERGMYVDPDPAAAHLAAHLNDATVERYREIYEVVE